MPAGDVAIRYFDAVDIPEGSDDLVASMVYTMVYVVLRIFFMKMPVFMLMILLSFPFVAAHGEDLPIKYKTAPLYHYFDLFLPKKQVPFALNYISHTIDPIHWLYIGFVTKDEMISGSIFAFDYESNRITGLSLQCLPSNKKIDSYATFIFNNYLQTPGRGKTIGNMIDGAPSCGLRILTQNTETAKDAETYSVFFIGSEPLDGLKSVELAMIEFRDMITQLVFMHFRSIEQGEGWTITQGSYGYDEVVKLIENCELLRNATAVESPPDG